MKNHYRDANSRIHTSTEILKNFQTLKNINFQLKYYIIENLLILFIKYLFFVYTKISYTFSIFNLINHIPFKHTYKINKDENIL